MSELKFNNQRNFDPKVMRSSEFTALDLSNPKEFFIKEDGISNSGYETFISVFQRYRCEAGCDVCYIKDRWIAPDGTDYFDKYTKPVITQEHEARLMDAFSHFTTVSTIDDLFFIKHNHPALYEFYKTHSGMMNLTSMTDMAVLQQVDLAVNDLNFMSVYDVTFSDSFLAKPKITDAIIRKLDMLNERYPMVKIRFIVSGDPLVDRNGIKRVINWAKSHGIYTMAAFDNRVKWNFNAEIMDMVDHHDAAHIIDDTFELHQIYSEVSHLMYDRWVVSFYESTQDDDKSFYTLKEKFVPSEWLEAHVRHKLKHYARSAKKVTPNDYTAPYVKYYEYTSQHVQVNSNWNFIPTIMMNKRSDNMHKGLLREGFVETQFGLVKPEVVTGAAAPVPLYQFV